MVSVCGECVGCVCMCVVSMCGECVCMVSMCGECVWRVCVVSVRGDECVR